METATLQGAMSAAWQQVQAKPLKASPGKARAYNQMEAEVVRRIAEEVTGQSWKNFVRERTLEPSDMQSTYFLHEPSSDSSRVTTGYVLENGSVIAHNWVESYDYYIPTAVGLFSTTGDLARLSNTLRSGNLLTASTHRAMWSPSSHKEGGLKGLGGRRRWLRYRLNCRHRLRSRAQVALGRQSLRIRPFPQGLSHRGRSYKSVVLTNLSFL